MSELWTHPSLHRAPEWSVTRRYVLRGSVIEAVLDSSLEVRLLDGPPLGRAASPAHAMLMVMRHWEAVHVDHAQ